MPIMRGLRHRHAPRAPLHWGMVTVVVVVVVSSVELTSSSSSPAWIEEMAAVWRWQCVSAPPAASSASASPLCVKVRAQQRLASHSDEKGLQKQFFSLDGCHSLCGAYGALWPRPSSPPTLSRTLTPLATLDDEACCRWTLPPGAPKELPARLLGAWRRLPFVADASNATGASGGFAFNVAVSVTRAQLHLDLDTPEDYTLSVRTMPQHGTVSVTVRASTYFGARHAFETLGQLVTFDGLTRRYHVVSHAEIADRPLFPYRGLLLDTGRNYFPVASIEQILDGMSFDKLNVLHWHMNEQQSFPFVSATVPEMTKYGAYSKDELYFPEQVQHLVRYGLERGVLLLPEFDAPAHAMAGWRELAADEALKAGQKQKQASLLVCAQKEWADGNWSLAAEPPSGQLNPLNERVYEILNGLYSDFLSAFTVDNQSVPMFHMGGDEINFSCWAQDPGIQQWLQSKGYPTNPELDPTGYLELWALFQKKAKQKLVEVNQGNKFKHDIILWTSELAKVAHIERYLPREDYVIQIWCNGDDPWIADLLSKGYRTIFSNSDAWYLDCGFGAWIYSGQGEDKNWCSPFKTWKTVYDNSPRQIARNMGLAWEQVQQLVLGGEAALWSEQADASSAQSRLWPRLSALAERLWSDPEPSLADGGDASDTGGWRDAEPRLLQQRQRFQERGLRPDAIQPEFCRQNQGWCYMPPRKFAGGGFDTNEMMLAMFEQQQQQDEQNRRQHDGFVLNEARQRHRRKMAPSSTYYSVVTLLSALFIIVMLYAAWFKRRVIFIQVLFLLRTLKDKVSAR